MEEFGRALDGCESNYIPWCFWLKTREAFTGLDEGRKGRKSIDLSN